MAVSAGQPALGAYQRILYALVGLVVGNCAVNLVNLVVVVQKSESASGHMPVMRAGPFVLFPAIFLVSLYGWVLLGLPFTLFLPAKVIGRIHPLIGLGIGGAMGPLSLALIGVIGSLRLRTPILSLPPGLYLYAAVVGGPAIAIYVALVRRFNKSSSLADVTSSPRERA